MRIYLPHVHRDMDDLAKKTVNRYGLMAAGVLIVAYFFVYFHRMTGGAISDTLQDFYGVDEAAVGILASAYLYAYMAMQIPSGLITDRFGPRRAASLFVLILSLGSFMCAVSAMEDVRSFPLMVFGRAVIGIGASVISVPYMKVFATWFRKGRFSTLIGIAGMVGNIGAICAAYPMVLMIDGIGLPDTYMALTAVTLAISFAIWVLVRDGPKDRGLPEITELYPEEYSAKETDPKPIPVMESLGMVFSGGRAFWPMVIAMALLYGTFMLWSAAFGGTYYGRSGMDQDDYAMVLMFVGVGMLVAAPAVGFITDRLSRGCRPVILFMTAGLTTVWVVISMTSDSDLTLDVPVQMAINFMLGFFCSAFVLSYGEVKMHYPLSIAGTVSACVNVFPFLGGAVCTSVAGFLIDGTLEDFRAVWWACAVLAAMSFLASLFIRPACQDP